MSALLTAIRSRDRDAALHQLAIICKMFDPPTVDVEEAAWLAVFDRVSRGILYGDWSKVDRIRSEGYFTACARREMRAIERERPTYGDRPRHLLNEKEACEQTGYHDNFDDEDAEQPLSSVERVRAILNFSSRDVFDWLVAQGTTERYRFQHGDCQRIADELGVHRNSITKALKDIQRAWRCL